MQGRDKLLEQVDGSPLLRRTVDLALPHGTVFVTLPDPDHPRRFVLPQAARIVAVPDHASGMSASLRAGAAAIPPGHPVLVLPADMPEITGDDIAAILAARDAVPDALMWQGAATDGTPGHPVLFHESLVAGFADLAGDEGARSIIAAHKDRRHLVPLPGRHALTDLDTPEAWAAWRASR